MDAENGDLERHFFSNMAILDIHVKFQERIWKDVVNEHGPR